MLAQVVLVQQRGADRAPFGVELAQLTIVVVALPLTWLLARAIGAAAYRRYALPALAAVLGGLGLVWLIERLFAVTLLGL